MKPAGTGDADIGAVVTAGVMIRLEHFTTQRNLHSHEIPAQRTKSQNEVSCYKTGDKGDANDLFRIEWYPQGKLRLIHISTNCALHSHDIKYKSFPRQQEVTCFSGRDDNDFWIIQEVNAPASWKPSMLGLTVSDDEQDSHGNGCVPFDVFLCKCA